MNHTSRGFSSLIALLLVVIVIAVGLGYFASNKSEMAEQTNIKNSNRLQVKKISFVPPEGWTVEQKISANEGESYILRSPDYQPSKSDCKVGGYCNLPARGIEIGVSGGGFWERNLSSEENMRAFVEDFKEICSNCVSEELVKVDRVPALFGISAISDIDLGAGESASVGFQIEDTQYNIGLTSPGAYIENEKLFEAFLSQVKIEE